MFSIKINHFFYKKTKPLYPNLKYLYGIGILIWSTTRNLGFSYRVSVVRAPNRESKRAKLITTFPSGGDGARMNTKAGTQGTLEKLG